MQCYCMRVLLCPEHIFFAVMKDTAGKFTEESRPDSSVCTCECARTCYTYVYVDLSKQRNFFFLKSWRRKQVFFLIYLLRKEAEGMMKHLQCQSSHTTKNKNFLMKYKYRNTKLVFKAQCTTTVGRKLACYSSFALY